MRPRPRRARARAPQRGACTASASAPDCGALAGAPDRGAVHLHAHTATGVKPRAPRGCDFYRPVRAPYRTTV